MKDFQHYNTVDAQYPERIAKPQLSKNATPSQIREYATAVEEYEAKMVEYRKEKDLFQLKRRERDEEFKRDLFEEFGVTNNPKADKCYAIAYDMGHSSGFSDIYAYFSDIVELIQ